MVFCFEERSRGLTRETPVPDEARSRTKDRASDPARHDSRFAKPIFPGQTYSLPIFRSAPFLLDPPFSLLASRFSLLATRYSLLASHYSLLSA
jgi:hypothetical protein